MTECIFLFSTKEVFQHIHASKCYMYDTKNRLCTSRRPTVVDLRYAPVPVARGPPAHNMHAVQFLSPPPGAGSTKEVAFLHSTTWPARANTNTNTRHQPPYPTLPATLSTRAPPIYPLFHFAAIALAPRSAVVDGLPPAPLFSSSFFIISKKLPSFLKPLPPSPPAAASLASGMYTNSSSSAAPPSLPLLLVAPAEDDDEDEALPFPAPLSPPEAPSAVVLACLALLPDLAACFFRLRFSDFLRVRSSHSFLPCGEEGRKVLNACIPRNDLMRENTIYHMPLPLQGGNV